MKTFMIFLIFFISFSDSLYSQIFKKPIDYRYKGGEDNYIAFFSKNISIPDKAMQNGIFGNSITRISLNPNGEIIEVATINSIDSLIDNEVLRTINLSRAYWRKSDTINYNQVFFIQIGFSRPEYFPHLFEPKSEVFIRLFPKPILIPLEADYKIPFFKREELTEKANQSIDKGELEKALYYINELIKRDPFNRELYKTRIMLNIRLKRPDLVEEDDNKIFNFAEGYSLDEIFKNQDQ